MSCENRETKIPDFLKKSGILLFTTDLGLLYCHVRLSLRPNPTPSLEGKQESKPLDLSGRGMEAGFQE
jgi:hypothetical protein